MLKFPQRQSCAWRSRFAWFPRVIRGRIVWLQSYRVRDMDPGELSDIHSPFTPATTYRLFECRDGYRGLRVRHSFFERSWRS